MAKKLELKGERLEALIPLCDNNRGWAALLEVVNEIVTEIDKEVLEYNLLNGLEKLGILKARSEGARKILSELREIQNNVKAKIVRNQTDRG